MSPRRRWRSCRVRNRVRRVRREPGDSSICRLRGGGSRLERVGFGGLEKVNALWDSAQPMCWRFCRSAIPDKIGLGKKRKPLRPFPPRALRQPFDSRDSEARADRSAPTRTVRRTPDLARCVGLGVVNSAPSARRPHCASVNPTRGPTLPGSRALIRATLLASRPLRCTRLYAAILSVYRPLRRRMWPCRAGVVAREDRALTMPSAAPSVANPCFFCMSSGISLRRSARSATVVIVPDLIAAPYD